MKLFFDLKVDDWVSFQEYFKEKKAPLYKYISPLLIFSAVLIVTINAMHLYYQEASIVTLFSFILLVILFYLLYLKKQTKKQLRKIALDIQAKTPDAFGPREMDFNERRVEISAGKSHKTLAWGELTRYEENNDYFFLYSQKGMVYIIPKRDLEKIPEIREMLNEYLPKT